MLSIFIRQGERCSAHDVTVFLQIRVTLVRLTDWVPHALAPRPIEATRR
jgi:hypothetical protein